MPMGKAIFDPLLTIALLNSRHSSTPLPYAEPHRRRAQVCAMPRRFLNGSTMD